MPLAHPPTVTASNGVSGVWLQGMDKVIAHMKALNTGVSARDAAAKPVLGQFRRGRTEAAGSPRPEHHGTAQPLLKQSLPSSSESSAAGMLSARNQSFVNK